MNALFRLPDALVERGYALRAETETDLPFLKRLYASAREAELAPLAQTWSSDQLDAFVDQQFAAQRHHYRSAIAGCRFAVIEHCSAPTGRLYLQPRITQIQLVDIALIPSHRGQGVGTAILTALIETARADGKGVGLFVEGYNPALRLYLRLGFTEIRRTPAYIEMERRFDSSEIN